MDEFMLKIYNMCKDRFGPATDVDIHVNAYGITVTTESRALDANQDANNTLYLDQHRIDGELLKRI